MSGVWREGAMPLKPRPLTERMKEKVRVNAETGCHEWVAGRGAHGYGVFWHSGRQHLAHRVSWELERGPIPTGLHIDHLCRNRGCVNPDHLEPVTPRENILRSPIAPPALNQHKTHCSKGHELTPENLDAYALKTGRRACKECMRRRCREWHHRNRDDRLETMREYKRARRAGQ